MISAEWVLRAMPTAYESARSLETEPSKPTTTPCRKAGSQAWRRAGAASGTAADSASGLPSAGSGIS